MSERATTLNTKRMLARSLWRAVVSKPIDKVTVSEIVEDSGVNRKTFYYHFDGVPSLLEWMLTDEAVDVVKQFTLPQDFGPAMEFSLRYIEKNRVLLRNAFSALGTEKMRRMFYQDFRHLVEAFFDSTVEAGTDPDYREFVVHFCTEGLAAQIIDWIHERSVLDRATMARYLVKVLESTTAGGTGVDPVK